MNLRSAFCVRFIFEFVVPTSVFLRFNPVNPLEVFIRGGGLSLPFNVIEANDTFILSCAIETPVKNPSFQWQCRNRTTHPWSNCESADTRNVTVTTSKAAAFYQCKVHANLGNKTVTRYSHPLLVLQQTDHNNNNNTNNITNYGSESSFLDRFDFLAVTFIAVVELLIICGLLFIFLRNSNFRSYKFSPRKGKEKTDQDTRNGIILEDGDESPPLKARRRKTTESVDEDGYILPIQLAQTRTCGAAKCKTDSTYMELHPDDEDTYEIPAIDPLYENVATLLRVDKNDTKSEQLLL